MSYLEVGKYVDNILRVICWYKIKSTISSHYNFQLCSMHSKIALKTGLLYAFALPLPPIDNGIIVG